jgi:hypothetical protein
MPPRAASLFGADVPDGFEYCSEFISVGEEPALADAIAHVEFFTFEMRGIAGSAPA